MEIEKPQSQKSVQNGKDEVRESKPKKKKLNPSSEAHFLPLQNEASEPQKTQSSSGETITKRLGKSE